MKPYNKNDIEQIYNDLIKSANRYYSKHKINDALKDIIAAARWAYQFNFIYTDPKAENLLKRIGEEISKPITISKCNHKRCVLIDSFLWDNRGLSQQYLRAMMSNNMEILIIHTRGQGAIGEDIMKELDLYKKAIIVDLCGDTSFSEQTKRIVTAISDFSPRHIFLHLTPWDVVPLMATHLVNGSVIYNINLTDHAYWMGASFIDYNIEFRPYGMTVSLEKRGLKTEQIINLPYYPITKKQTEFLGFPTTPKDAIKMFTGGSLYKMLGKDDFFFKILESILMISPKVYIFVAGFSKNQQFDEKLQKIKGRERILQIGVRKDIDEVFEHCDIYLGTYPMMGGLMSQYAAIHAKPIIAYHDKDDVMNTVEEVVNYYQQEFRSFTDIEAMAAYAKKLIEDSNFRQEQGKILQNGMITELQFNKEFSNVIANGYSSFRWKKDKIDYDGFFNWHLDLENNEGFGTTKWLVRDLGLPILWKISNKNRGIIRDELFLYCKSRICYTLKRIIKGSYLKKCKITTHES